MQCKNLFLIFVFLLIFLVPTISAVPPFQATNLVSSNSLQIETPVFDVVKINQNYTFHFHVFNVNGSFLTNASTSCILHIYDFQTGDHILQQSAVMDSNMIDFDVSINDSLLTKEGNYFRLIQCNTSSYGGFLGTQFKVGYSMREASVQDAIINSVIIFLLVIFFITCLTWALVTDGENKFTMGPEGDTFLELNYGKYLKLFLYLLSYLFFWMLTWSIWQVVDKFALSSTFTEVLKLLFIIETIFWPILIIAIVVIGFVKQVSDSEIARLVKRGLKPR